MKPQGTVAEVAGHVERVAELGPLQPVPRVLRPVLRDQAFGGEGGDRDGGGDEEVPVLEPGVDLGDIGILAGPHGLVVGHGDLCAVFHAGDQMRVHAVFPLGQILGEALHVGGPELHDQVAATQGPQSGFTSTSSTPAALAGFRRPCGPGRRRRVDAGMAEIGAVGDLPAFDPVIEAAEIVGRPGFERGVVERVRAGHHRHHQRAVGDGAGHRADMGGVVAGADRVVGDAAIGGLEAGDAAEMGRHADRAVVAALVQGAVAGRRGGAGTGGGGAGVVAVLPGIVGDAGERAVGDAGPAELGDVVLPSAMPPAACMRATAGRS